jgi:hypothetical protein
VAVHRTSRRAFNLDGERAVPFDEAVVLGRHGGKREKGQGSNSTLTDRGTTTDYTVARLRRDAPELAEAVVRGERLELVGRDRGDALGALGLVDRHAGAF